MKDQSGINYFKNLLSRKVTKQDIRIENIKTYSAEAVKNEFKPKPYIPKKEEFKEIIYNSKKLNQFLFYLVGQF